MREMYTFPPRRLGVDVINSLVTFVLSVWQRPHQILPQTLISSLFSSQSIYRNKLFVWFWFFETGVVCVTVLAVL